MDPNEIYDHVVRLSIHKQLTELSVAKDVARLSRKIQVFVGVSPVSQLQKSINGHLKATASTTSNLSNTSNTSITSITTSNECNMKSNESNRFHDDCEEIDIESDTIEQTNSIGSSDEEQLPLIQGITGPSYQSNAVVEKLNFQNLKFQQMQQQTSEVDSPVTPSAIRTDILSDSFTSIGSARKKRSRVHPNINEAIDEEKVKHGELKEHEVHEKYEENEVMYLGELFYKHPLRVIRTEKIDAIKQLKLDLESWLENTNHETLNKSNQYTNTSTAPMNELLQNAIMLKEALSNTDENDEAVETKEIIFLLFYTLKRHISNDIPMDWKHFSNCINLSKHDTITTYMLETFKDNGAITSIFKSCNQTIIARVLRVLRDKGLTFKDARGSWHINIQLSPDGRLGSTTHNRHEMMLHRFEDGFNFVELFKFEWELETFYDLISNEIINVAIRLIKIEDISCDPAYKRQYEKARAKLLSMFHVEASEDESFALHPPEQEEQMQSYKKKKHYSRCCSMM